MGTIDCQSQQRPIYGKKLSERKTLSCLVISFHARNSLFLFGIEYILLFFNLEINDDFVGTYYYYSQKHYFDFLHMKFDSEYCQIN